MKRLKYLLLASLVAFAACDEEEPVGAPTGAVRVTVTAGGAPLQGITVSLGAAGTQPVVTGADGIANFPTVPVGTYTVTVTGLSADVVCSSTTQPVTVAGGETTAVQFACNIVRTSSLSGTVAFSNGTPRPNATVTITRTLPAPADPAVNVTTDANGRYSLTGLRSGTYTVSLPVTTGCTTAASTQTVTIAAGEARVVNFTCTVAAPPVVPATVAIQSITVTNPLTGAQVPVPSNQLAGVVNVSLGIEEGDQRVSRVRLRLGDQVVCDQTFVAAAPEMELATFNVTCPVNTAEFNQTTGAPRFTNAQRNLVVDIFTVAGGNTTPVHSATLSVTTVNVDATYAVVTPQRTALSTNTTAGGAANAGRTWWNGDLTIRALPVMYSGLAVQNVTVMVTGWVPEDGTDDLANYYGGSGSNETVARLDTSAPYEITLLAADDIDDDSDPFDAGNGIGQVEDGDVTGGLQISISVLRSDGQPGPSVNNVAAVCTGNVLVNFANFPVTGCADGQPANLIRYDTNAPVVGQLDRMYRWSSSYASPSRAEPGAVVAAFSGVTGWVHEGYTFSATRLVPGDDAVHSTQATAPRVADLGVGLPATGFAIFRMGTATDQMQVVTTPAGLTETFNNDVYYGNITVQDVFGAMGATTNQRTRFYDTSYDGTGTSSANLAAIQAAGSNARAGIDKGDPCFSANGTTCDNNLLNTNRLDLDREVIGTTGTLTIGNGGVMDGTEFVGQILDLQGPEGGTPSLFPTNPAITRLRRFQPGIGTSAGCHIGVISNNACQFAGATSGLSGTTGSFDFNVGSYTQINPVTNAVTTVTADRGGVTLAMGSRTTEQNTGYYLLEMRAVDNAGNSSATVTRTFVWDRTAPVVGGVSSPPTATAGGQTTFSVGVADELDLDRAELFLRWSGVMAVLQNTTQIGEFGQAAYTTSGTASATVPFFHSLRVAGGAETPTSNSVFRVFDFGRNVAEGVGAVPVVTNPPAEPNDITAASLYASANVLCWDTDSDGCTNPTNVTLSFQVTGPTSVPFNRVDFLVGIDADNNGVVDVDGSGTPLFAPITSGSAVSVIQNVATFSRNVTVQQLVTAARRSSITDLTDPSDDLTIRAIGYRPNGTAFTVANVVVACPAATGSDDACTIQLQRD